MVSVIHSCTVRPVTADVQEPAQTEPSDPPTPIYITPLPPGYLATLPTDQQQSHWDAINALHHPQASFSTGISDLSGKYITPMPPQNILNTSLTSNQQPSRDKGRMGGQGGQRGKGASRAGRGQRQGGQTSEARDGGNQRSSTENNGDSQSDAPQPQRKQARRRNKPKGSNNSG
jgi:hypothetical protein